MYLPKYVNMYVWVEKKIDALNRRDYATAFDGQHKQLTHGFKSRVWILSSLLSYIYFMLYYLVLHGLIYGFYEFGMM